MRQYRVARGTGEARVEADLGSNAARVTKLIEDINTAAESTPAVKKAAPPKAAPAKAAPKK